MRSSRVSADRLRNAALFALAAFALHQLRYLLAAAAGAGEGATGNGHGYLGAALLLLISISLIVVVKSLVAASSGSVAPPLRLELDRTRKWLSRSLALFAVFAAQELVEATLTVGRSPGLAAVVGHGGWIALPLSLLLGGLLTLALHGLSVVERKVALYSRRTRERPPLVVGRARRAAAPPLAGRALAFGLARRPPPHLLTH